MTKSHILVANAPERVLVPTNDEKPIELETCQKCGRPIGAKYKNPQKRKAVSLRESLKEKPLEEDDFSQRAIANDETQTETTEPIDLPDMTPGVDVINENYDILINFVNTGEKLDRNSLIVTMNLPQQ